MQLTVPEAGALRAKAADQTLREKQAKPVQGGASIAAFAGAWTAQGPTPIVQAARSGPDFISVSGRVTALAVKSSPPYTVYLGAAQGGLWTWDAANEVWVPKTDQLSSLAIGAIALAPSNENIVYVGTGEGSLSGDSYFGNGVLKSTNGGNTFSLVSGTSFNQVSISKIVVDPTNANHLYAATLRGRAGKQGSAAPNPTPYGIYESTNGGTSWTPRFTTTNPDRGATSLVIDPQFNGTTNRILLAAIWGEGIVKSIDGGQTWARAMDGLPDDADYTKAQTRFALGISHPSGANATVYTGFEWYDTAGIYHPSTIWKSTDAGTNWAETNTEVVGGYCGVDENNGQCFYDNEIGVDPTNPDVVYALGWFNYDTGTGGVYRSLDGGATWRDLGSGQHPDFHAIAIRRDAPENIFIGNDGGVWGSANRGGRIEATAPITDVDWVNLNGTVNDNLSATGTDLQITQFTSIGQHPTNNRLYGGAQDNGTSRKINTVGPSVWYDFANGDGGQVLVDPQDPTYVYGTYYGISPYRFDNGMTQFGSNETIVNGINTRDRSEFYVPFNIDKEYSNRLYLGTYRLYRTDNRGDNWRAISGDLTSGCTGRASNGGRGCYISAIGTTAGASAVYAGTEEGYIQLAPTTDVAEPAWARVDRPNTPKRPIASIAVDNSNYRVAYVAFNGFDAATPTTPGHVFKTINGGQSWTNVSGNLPDAPVNSILIDPAMPNTIYAGTDTGPFVTTNGGTSWSPLGTGFPIVAVHQLDLNAYTHRLAAATHGRGAWTITNSTTAPALSVRTLDNGTPVGPNSNLVYTITVKNRGNAAATGVTISAPIPANTSFVAATGGTLAGGTVNWGGLNAPAASPTDPTSTASGLTPGSTTVTLTVKLADTLVTGDVVTSDGVAVTSSEVATVNGSPYSVTVAPANALTLTPESQFDGTRSGQAITYTLTLQNNGYLTDTYNITATDNTWPTTLYKGDFSAPSTSLASVVPGATATLGVRVDIPASAVNNAVDGVKVTATSATTSTVKVSATISTTAVTNQVLLVDEDGDAPDVRVAYTAALSSTGIPYNVYDLAANPVLPPRYVKAHKAVIWFTGATYPNPITPYEPVLAPFLQGGGRLFMSGWDILDQSGGLTDFVHDYLHIDWDGSDAQNDLGTTTVTGVPTNTLTADLGTLPFEPKVLFPDGGDYSDEITPIAPAVPAFLDDKGQTNALSVEDSGYKVVFLAFPFEGLGAATDRAKLMQRTLKYFDVQAPVIVPAPTSKRLYLPLIAQK